MNIIKLNAVGDIVKRVEGGTAPIVNQSKEVVITENGTTTIKPDKGFTGLSSVKIVVALPIDVSNYFTIEALEDDLTVSNMRNNVEYCIDGNGMWQTLNADDDTPPINTGQTISFKANLSQGQQLGRFVVSKKYNVSGNIMSLLYGDKSNSSKSLEGYTYVFEYFFSGGYKETNLIDASNLILPATTLEVGCYSKMFSGCASLVSAPALPATNLITECYDSMFYGCTSLVNAPVILATTLAWNSCKSMFSGCTSLVNAPVLPATTLGRDCYEYMFSGCTSLVNAPELPATTLVDDCYRYMFNGCTSLTYIKMMATDISANNCLYDWVNGVASSGTFVKNAAATWDVVGVNGVPEGWTVETATE